MGMWLIMLHNACIPQDPGQGFIHFSRMHAKLLEHSGLIEHSGLQLGGLPIYPLKHEQDGNSPIFRHSLFGPHGDGKHGLVMIGEIGSEK